MEEQLIILDDDIEEAIVLEEDNEEAIVLDDLGYIGKNNYRNDINKPKINGEELIDDKSSKELHLQDEMFAISNLELEEIFKY